MTDLDHAKVFLEIIPRTMRSYRVEIGRVVRGSFTIQQYRLLAKITRDRCSNKQLAEWMGVSAPAMSNMIDKLIRKGMVRRQDNAADGDRRVSWVIATPKGEAQVKRVRGVVQQLFARRISGLSVAKKRNLLAGLEVLRELF